MLTYNEFMPEINEKRFYFHFIDRADMYYSGNLALESVIQEKQMELDNDLTLSSTKRDNAYEHYKIWMVHGEIGPIMMMRKHLINARDLFMDTRAEIEKRTGKLWFYLKVPSYLREGIGLKQKLT